VIGDTSNVITLYAHNPLGQLVGAFSNTDYVVLKAGGVATLTAGCASGVGRLA
jgi:hypothetical protein